MTSKHWQLTSVFQQFEQSREAQFWGLQFLGWGGLCIITFLSLTVWYGTPNLSHISHTIVQALLGVMLCVPLRYIYRKVWTKVFWQQAAIIGGSIIGASVLWTLLRMQAFLWLGQEYDIWKDFGGWYFGSFMVFLSWTSLYFGSKVFSLLQLEREQRYIATQQIQDEQLKRLSAETGSREAQIKMLRYQLNPHFLFNTLNSISALVKTKRLDQARSMISQLSDFLRFSLDNDAYQKVTLEDEIKALELYLNIEKVRYQDRLNVVFQISSRAKKAYIPSLILQPLLENSLKYAVAGKIDGGTIHMKAHIRAGALHISVDDTGPGLERAFYKNPDKTIFENGVGLKNIADRLKSHYGSDVDFRFSRSNLGGLCVKIKIPFENKIFEPAKDNPVFLESQP